MKLLISIGGWVGIGVAAVLVLAVIIWIIATFNKFRSEERRVGKEC